jgi:hypothetical protein
MQAIVSQTNIEEEQKSREVEQQIAEIQGKDLCRQQSIKTFATLTYQPSH